MVCVCVWGSQLFGYLHCFGLRIPSVGFKGLFYKARGLTVLKSSVSGLVV